MVGYGVGAGGALIDVGGKDETCGGSGAAGGADDAGGNEGSMRYEPKCRPPRA